MLECQPQDRITGKRDGERCGVLIPVDNGRDSSYLVEWLMESTIWNRRFLLALAGHFSIFMSIALFFLFPVYLKELSASDGRIGFIMGMNSVVIIFVRPLVGRWIDRRGRRRISLLGAGLLILIFPLFLLVREPGWLPVILRAGTGLGWGVAMTGVMTMCSDLAPAGRLAHAMGIIGIAGLVSQALGPWLGETLMTLWGFRAVFVACTLLAVMAFVFIFLTREDNHSRPGGTVKSFALRDHATLIIIAVALMPLIHGAVRGSVVYFVSLLIRSRGLVRVGPFFFAFAVSAVLTRLTIGDLSDRLGRKRVILPGALIIALNLVLLSLADSMWLVVLTALIGGFGQGLLFPALSTYLIDWLGEGNKGLAISLYLTLFDIGLGFGSPLFGRISELRGYSTMYICAALLLVVTVLFFQRFAPDPNIQKPVAGRKK